MEDELPRSKQDRHETAVGVRFISDDDPAGGNRRRDGSLVDTRPLWGPHNVPDTIEEALMVCEPFAEPQVSREELDTGTMVSALALLTPKERSVVELVVFGQMSLSQAGIWLGEEYGRGPYSKQGVANIRDVALAKMRTFYEQAA